MGEVKVGDQIVGTDGKPASVVASTQVMFGRRPCYRIEFSDGEMIVADADHLWKTTDLGVVTTHVGASPAAA